MRTGWLVCGSLLMGACAGGDDAGPQQGQVQVDTVNGVEIVHHSVDYVPDLGWSIGPPQLQLGQLDGDEADVFGSIGGVAVDSTGRLFVGDAQAMEIRVFSPDGAHLYTFGRSGGGPGEFENIDAMRITPAGVLLVRDVNRNRISAFTLEGEFLRQLILERAFPQYAQRPTLWADRAGRIYDWVMLRTDGGAMGVAVYADSDSLLAQIETDAHTPEYINLMRGDARVLAMPVPMTPFASGAVDRAGQIVSGVGDAYELEVRNLDGLTRRVLRDLRPEAPPGWLDDTLQARLDQVAEEMGDVTPEEFTLPEHAPYFTHIFIDDLDHWWVGRDGDRASQPTRYDIFTPGGRFLGSVELPRLLRLMQIGERFIAGVATDELGVERVVVLPLERSTPLD